MGQGLDWTLCLPAPGTAAAIPSRVVDQLELGREDEAREDRDGGAQVY